MDNETTPTIKASAHSDDRYHEIEFDAKEWFEQASDEDIKRLIECGFGGDYGADAVAEYFDGKIPEITRMFEHIGSINPLSREMVGFECYVDEFDARQWIGINRKQIELDDI